MFRDFKQIIVPLRGDSNRMAKTFDDRIDLLFIDADHSYEGCLNDWLSWNRFLAPGAIAAFHDISWAEGVIRVVRDRERAGSKKEVYMNNMYLAWL